VKNAWERIDYRMDIMGMINSWRVMKGALVVAWSLLGFTEFRKGRNGMLYVVRFLEAVVEATISGSNVSAFDVSAWDGYASEDPEPPSVNIRGLPETAIIALEGRLPSNTFGAYVTLGS
jgi:hypothetical protein